MKTLEVVNFSNKKFHEIPEQDNPAYDKHECLLLVDYGDGKKVLLIHIKPVDNPKENESVHRVAVFFDESTAMEVADLYAERN